MKQYNNTQEFWIVDTNTANGKERMRGCDEQIINLHLTFFGAVLQRVSTTPCLVIFHTGDLLWVPTACYDRMRDPPRNFIRLCFPGYCFVWWCSDYLWERGNEWILFSIATHSCCGTMLLTKSNKVRHFQFHCFDIVILLHCFFYT